MNGTTVQSTDKLRHMVKISPMRNTDRLFDTLKKCTGDVYYVRSGGNMVNISKNRTARSLVEEAYRGRGMGQMCVAVENEQDLKMLIQHLIA